MNTLSRSQSDLARQMTNLFVIPASVAFAYVADGAAHNVAWVTRTHESLFSTASWASVIWAVIFAAQCMYAVYQSLPAQAESPLLRRIGWHTALNAVLLALWTVAFSFESFALAWALLVGMLANLVAVERRWSAFTHAERDVILVRLPFATNLAWVAMVAILHTSLLVHQMGNPSAHVVQVVGAQALAVGAAMVGAFMLVRQRNFVFPCVVIWTLCAVGAYRFSVAPSLGVLAFTLSAALMGLLFMEGMGVPTFPLRPRRL